MTDDLPMSAAGRPRSRPFRNLRFHRVLTPSDTEAYDHAPDAIRIEGSTNANISIVDRSGELIQYKIKEGFTIIDQFDVWKIMDTGTSGITQLVGGYYEMPQDPLTVPEEQSRFYKGESGE